MKAADISAAIVAMAKATDFIRNNSQPSVQEMRVRHELDDAANNLKSALHEIKIQIAK